MLLLLPLLGVYLVSAGCPFGYTLEPNSNKCYKINSVPSSYFAAQFSCTEDGANLASITNGFENTFIGSLLPFGVTFYIGLNRLINANQWTWLDETPVSYTNFYPGQIYNESCVSFMASNNAWFVTPCSRNLGFICSTPTSCPACPTCNGTCAARCDSGWAYFDRTHSCYRTLLKGDWYTAEEDCEFAGGHLASIHSQEENSFVMGLSQEGYEGYDEHQPYIGLHRLMNGTWVWTDGSPVNYTNWQVARPRETPYDCAYVFSDDYSGGGEWYSRWESNVCSDEHRAFVCKKPAY